MSQPARPSLTELLEAAAGGDRSRLDEVFARVYPELRRLAHVVRGGRAGETLATTALAHEAYLKLVPGGPVAWKGRAHFLAVAARAMRQVLVDAARSRLAGKRGAGAWAVTFDEAVAEAPVRAEGVVALDEALERLAAAAPRRALVVEYRFFGGLTTEEIAAALGTSTATVEREWRTARAWLAAELAPR